MASASWKGQIVLGPLIHVPVVARSAVRETKIMFNLHHAGCGGRARSGLSICDGCGRDIGRDEIVRGFEGKAGVDDDYLKSLAREKTDRMELDGLVPADQIDPRYYAKSYTVTPQKGGEKGYVLLLRLLEKHSRVAVGKVVMGGKELIVTIRPRAGVLAMEVMYWPEELLADADARQAIDGVEVSRQELVMGDQLVRFLARDFEPEAYRNEYAEAVAAYLERFLADEEQPAIPAPKREEATSASLEDALAASIRALGGQVEKKVAKRKGKVA